MVDRVSRPVSTPRCLQERRFLRSYRNAPAGDHRHTPPTKKVFVTYLDVSKAFD